LPAKEPVHPQQKNPNQGLQPLQIRQTAIYIRKRAIHISQRAAKEPHISANELHISAKEPYTRMT